VLLRTTNEYSSHIDFALLAKTETSAHNVEAERFVRAYFFEGGFADPEDKKPFRITQKQIHEAIGASLDATNSQPTATTPSSALLSSVYITLSSYVHAAYKTSMDLFGGRPGRFHLRGMPAAGSSCASIRTITRCVNRKPRVGNMRWRLLEIEERRRQRQKLLDNTQ